MKKRLNGDKLLMAALAVFLPVFLSSVYMIVRSLNAAGSFDAAFMTFAAAVLLGVFYLLFKREGFFASPAVLVCITLAFCAQLIARISLFEHVTLDYLNFLKPWSEHIKAGGGFKALSGQIGNYNIPYLAFLALISYLPANDLYLIKLFSVIFDLILAFYLMKLASVFTNSSVKQLICFFLALLLPTCVLNGSFWGQCDSVYTAFAVMSLYFALKGKPVLSVAAIAVSFSFKLQAVFVLPVFVLFLFSGKIKLRHLPVFPAVFFLCNLPAVLAGRPVWGCLTVYSSQLGTVGSGLNYNSPSVYSLFSNVQNPEAAARLGILSAFLLCMSIFTPALIFRRKLTDFVLLTAALLFVVMIPMVLPHMHDRYFFMADVLVLVFAVVRPVFSPLVPLVSFASLLGYHAYLKARYLLPMNYGFYALFAVFVILSIFFITRLALKSTGENERCKPS
jgi:Gpi18-like mannosyltransferase